MTREGHMNSRVEEEEKDERIGVFTFKVKHPAAGDSLIFIGLCILGCILILYAGFSIVGTAAGIATQASEQYRIPTEMGSSGIHLAYLIVVGILGLIPFFFIPLYLNGILK